MKRFLIVDDQALLRLLLKKFLEDHFHAICIEAASACEAIRILKTECFDIVISDQWMPEGNGTEIAAFLKTTGSTTPFILFTSDEDFEFESLVLKNDHAKLIHIMQEFGLFSEKSKEAVSYKFAKS